MNSAVSVSDVPYGATLVSMMMPISSGSSTAKFVASQNRSQLKDVSASILLS